MGYTFSQLIFIILGTIYIIVAVYSTFRLSFIRKFAKDWYLAKYFYILLVVENILSSAWFFLLGLFEQLQLDSAQGKDSRRIFWCLILIPDALFLITFLILAWQLLKLFIEGHSNTSDEIYLPDMRTKGIGYRVLIMFLSSYLIVEAILITLYVVAVIDFYSVSLQLSIINILIAGITVILFVVMTLMFSGNTYINREYKLKTNIVAKSVLIWSILKIIRGTAGLIKQGGLIQLI